MSMEFDELKKETCVVETTVNPTTCRPDFGTDDDGDGSGNDPGDGTGGNPGDHPVPPSDDDRCADPAFADAHPEICAGYPRLILKPAYAITESGKTVQYRTFLRTGGNEYELISGLNYTSGSVEVALIQAQTGLATGVQPGVGQIAVAWQNLHAFAKIEVVESCADLTSNFLLVYDQSLSSGVGFSGNYASRLDFAKAVGKKFAEHLNYSKDKIGVARFDLAYTTILGLSTDQSAIKAAINSIPVGAKGTSIGGGIHAAVNYMTIQANSAADRRIIVLLSDGEDNIKFSQSDPILISKAFKEAGGIVAVIALRAWGPHYDLLYKIASPGFFLSAHAATEQSVIDTLVEIKSFLCSGDCSPEPGTRPTAQLNYKNFVNWDVLSGAVDLIGLGIWDVLPGNGLYVDLAGTYDPPVSVPSPGVLQSKTEFNFTGGQQYRFSIYVAGNNVGQALTPPVKITIGSMMVETITPTGPKMPFSLYQFDFTPAGNQSSKIKIEMIGNNGNVGPLIDIVKLENIDTSSVLLLDNFDEENPTVHPPGYGYGYGCLEVPPPAQGADPTPPTPPLEG